MWAGHTIVELFQNIETTINHTKLQWGMPKFQYKIQVTNLIQIMLIFIIFDRSLN